MPIPQQPPFLIIILYKSFSSAPFRVIGSGKVIKSLLGNQPGIMNLGGRQISLPAQPLHRLRVYPEAVPYLYHIIIVIKRGHNSKYYFIKAILTPLIAPVKPPTVTDR
jgi:hypothetical protein